MYTVADILTDIEKGCLANNMVEEMYSYRIIFYVNEGNKGTKHYVNSSYFELRKTLEMIVRDNLSLTNNIVIAETTVLKNGKRVCLQSKSFVFSIESYFRLISGAGMENRNRNTSYSRYAVI